jgi:hypothetical protein
MIKIKIYELDKHRNETTFRPILFAKHLFKQIGIEFVTDGPADFAFVGHASFFNKKVSLSESVSSGLKFLESVKEPYFLFDGQDAATLIGSYEVFVQSKAIYLLKPTLYANRSEYLNKYANGRMYWGIGDYSIPSLDILDRIKLSGFNWLSTIQPRWLNYDNNKRFDVSAMFMYPHKDVFEHGLNQAIYYNKFRQNLFQNLSDKFNVTKLENGIRLHINEYYSRMSNSKIILAPFGFGEIAPRDLEAAMIGSVLIKPDMSHLETVPNLYVPNETYVSCKHDYSDLNEKIDYVLSDFNNLQSFYVENMRRRYTEVYDLNKLVLHYYDLFKNINGVTTEL